MKLHTAREPFLKHLQLVAATCPTRSVRPILKDVLIDVAGSSVTLLATDGEISLRTRYEDPATTGEGKAALPAATLLSAVRALPEGELTLQEKGSQFELTSGSSSYKLLGDDPEAFPEIGSLDPERSVTIPCQGFLELCQRTMFAAARDMGRYAFNGVLLELDPDEISLVGTDGRRLSLASLPLQTGVEARASAVVPVKGLTQLQRAASDEADAATDDEQSAASLRLEMRDNQVLFGLPFTEIVVQRVEGEFPDFRAVLPKEKDTPLEVMIGKGALESAIRQTSVTAGNDARSVHFAFESGRLKVSSRQEGVGEALSELEVGYEGDDVDLRFNPDFLGEYLKTVPEESVTFRFKDRTSAGYFSSVKGTVYVVMPITS